MEHNPHELGYDREAEYFAKKDAEFREKLREKTQQAAEELQRKREIAQKLGTADLSLAERIAALGFNGETAAVFDLVPLVHVAWADGSVQRKERQTILKLLEQRKIAVGSPGWSMMESLLEKKPSDAFLKESLSLLRETLAQKGQSVGDLVEMSVKVAEASGGFLGLSHEVSAEEKETLRQIAEQLGPEAQTTFRNRLKEV